MSEPSKRKVLLVSTIYPTSFGTGSQLRGAAVLRMLALRHEVYLVIVDLYRGVPGPVDSYVEETCREIKYLRISGASPDFGPIASLSGVEFVPAEFQDVSRLAASQTILKFYHDRGLDLLFVFRLQSIYALGAILPMFPTRHLDLDELPSVSEEKIRRIKLRHGETDEIKKIEGLRKIESFFIPKFHRVFVASEIEIERVREHTGVQRAELLPNISPARPFLPYHPREDQREILFVGNLGYFPNEDGVLYFCRDIYPLIRRQKGAAILFRICGFNCPPSIRELDGRDDIRVSGYVQDLRSQYAQATLVVVPLRTGGGTRLKILEAFCYGRPVVSTSIGAEGLAVTSGVNILLADDPGEFARACLDILDQPTLAGKLIDGGLQLNQTRYSENAFARAYYGPIEPCFRS